MREPPPAAAATAEASLPEVHSLESRTAQVDDLVRTAFEGTQPGATVVAVGGYGRRELFPYSDVDLLLLTDAAAHGQQRETRLPSFCACCGMRVCASASRSTLRPSAARSTTAISS